MTVASAAYASQAYGPAGGGTWDRGSKVLHGVWSNYVHPSKTHRSSVINGCGTYNGSRWINATGWSHSSATFCRSGTNRAYYDNQ
ncbi:MAG: hypothetical protein JHD16_08580 [Solirubrobacteraceae bacterium]|nr:hypothetical protein [Solirubrobacteraceae bacterium]